MNELDTRTIKRLADIKTALTGRAMTTNELADAIHINEWSAGDYLRKLHGNRVFVERWDCAPARIVAVYRWGNKPDAPKPRAKTALECERARIERIKCDPEAYDRYLAYHRGKYAARKASRRVNPWFGALIIGRRVPAMNVEG